MNKGRCLCGRVRWQFEGKPLAAHHCHCKMCRKAHGAAFGTYYFLARNQFSWESELNTVAEYRSSSELGRAFCTTCGSVVPNDEDGGEHTYVPAGGHDHGPAPDCHIFVAHKAPWFDITDELPRHDEFPPGVHGSVQSEQVHDEPQPGKLRGSCLCGAVEFVVEEGFKVVHHCHCSRCRYARAAAHTTNGFTSLDAVRFTKGEEHVKSYKVEDAKFFTHVFCDTCGSGLPRIDPGRGIAVTPLGALDDDPKTRAVDNIFVAHKAGWYDLTDDLPSFEEMPA